MFLQYFVGRIFSGINFHKTLFMKDLKQITVIGLGLLGGSISLAVLRSFARVKVAGYAHRASTREKARQLAVASEVVDDICQSVSNSDLVILATPLSTFKNISARLPVRCRAVVS